LNLSIIIPVYNEATQIQELLFHLLKMMRNPQQSEILVIDGGSKDNTVEVVNKIDGVRLITSEKGRGRQMNIGAKEAKGQTLYFLHADSFPPKDFDLFIQSKIKSNHKAGCFRMNFDATHPWLKLASWFTQFDVKFFRGGDQSLFIDRDLFFDIGGYVEEYPIFEDFTFIRELYKRNEFCVIQEPIISSSRRYQENGIARLQYHYWKMYIKKWFGASTQDLVDYYKKKVK